MNNLYNSILDTDDVVVRSDHELNWTDNIVWSKSKIKNFIFLNTKDYIEYKPVRKEIRVDDYIWLVRDELILDDAHNCLKDVLVSYNIYCTHAEQIDFKYRIKVGNAQTRQSHKTEKILSLRLCIGEPQIDRMARLGWPDKDSQWTIRVKKHYRDYYPKAVFYNGSAFDGSISVQDIIK